MTALLLVAHGSRDPRSAQTLERLRDRVDGRWDAGPVRLGYLEQRDPLLEDLLEQEPGEAVVVPLLLGAAYHARVDLPERLDRSGRAADVRVAPVLGSSDDLEACAAHEIDVLRANDGVDAVVLLGAGTSHAEAQGEFADLAKRLGQRSGVTVRAAYASAAWPVGDVVTGLIGSGHRVGVVPWFLAPGVLLDRGIGAAQDAGAAAISRLTLADSEAAADLVLTRARYARGSVACR
ncbi:sirohydrochlorin chelatase [Actinomycetota bacterium]|nr:sirohydrochlorin chelatase [Micrococcales bacterium]